MVLSGTPAQHQPRPSERVRVDFLRSEELYRAWPGLRHGFSFEWPRLDDTELQTAASAVLGLGLEAPWILQQPHGNEILDLCSVNARYAASAGRISVPGCDGAMVASGGNGSHAFRATLIVKAADCVSILAVLPKHRAYAALHAGWRGTAAKILPRLLSAWRADYGSLDGLHLAFGPHIRDCCFEVKEDCLAQFSESDLVGATSTRDGRTYVSLEQVLRTQARVHGVTDTRIDALPQCTQCHRDASGTFPFASYRRARQEGRPAGRNIAFIGPIR